MRHIPCSPPRESPAKHSAWMGEQFDPTALTVGKIFSVAHPELEGVVVWARQVPSDQLEIIHRAMTGNIYTDGRGIMRCEAGEAARIVVERCVV